MLFVGDIVVFFISLFITLYVRYGLNISEKTFVSHLSSFSILFLVWIVVYFISGLYDKHTTILKNKLPSILFNVGLINTAIAVLFFYLIPYFGITPKTNLFVYLLFSFVLMLFWRIKGFEIVSKKRKHKAIVIGSGREMQELIKEVNDNSRYDLHFISSVDIENIDNIDFQEEVLNRIYSEEIGVIAVDLRNEKVSRILPSLYNLIFSRVQFIDMHKLYEDIFDRVPLSLVKYSWFLENISLTPRIAYDFPKRIMDIIVGGLLALVSLVVYPFVIIAIKLEDGKEIFSVQTRVGKNNKEIKLIKFRSMAFTDGGDWEKNGRENYVTKVGSFIRKTRIDELPQLWNVLLGDVSLIGPRPEFSNAVKKYTEDIPYYNIRHLIKPGLSGWAQMKHDKHPHHGTDVVETKNKLSYDLFYIKNRSFSLDLKIALQTIQIMILVKGR